MKPETLQQILEAIRAVGAPHWLEISAWVAALFLVVVAAIALGHAANQVRRMTEANESALLQAHAALLLKLVRGWNDTAMVEAQHKIGELMRKIDADAKVRWKHLPPEEIKARSQEMYAEEMETLSKAGGLPYSEYMRLVGYLETLGYVARKGYLPKADIVNLFGGAVLSCRRVFYGHIKLIQAEPGTTGRAWEHAVWLMDEVRREADVGN